MRMSAVGPASGGGPGGGVPGRHGWPGPRSAAVCTRSLLASPIRARPAVRNRTTPGPANRWSCAGSRQYETPDRRAALPAGAARTAGSSENRGVQPSIPVRLGHPGVSYRRGRHSVVDGGSWRSRHARVQGYLEAASGPRELRCQPRRRLPRTQVCTISSSHSQTAPPGTVGQRRQGAPPAGREGASISCWPVRHTGMAVLCPRTPLGHAWQWSA